MFAVKRPVFTVLMLALLCTGGLARGEQGIWIAGWQETSPLDTPRAGAAVVAAGDHIYAVGGVDGKRFLNSVEYARIRSDGTLTAWQPTAPLNVERGFFDALSHNGYLYVAGGGNGPHGEHLLRSVERAPIRPDGRLGAWERLETQLVLPRRCVKLAVDGDTIYALGGFGGRLFDTVERAAFGADGRPGPFRLAQEKLTMPRYVNAAKQVDGVVYVLGGHRETEGVGHTEVEYAALGSDGLSWRPTATLRVGRYALSAAADGGYLYALGGLDGAIYTDVVEVARIAGDGTLSPWVETTPLPSPRANFGTVTHRGRIYIVGGTNRDGYYRAVQYADIDAAGDLGFRTTPAEARAYERRREERLRRRALASRLPNEGVIEEIIHTGSYSYIRVRDGAHAQWIAAPRTDYAVDERIRYSRGVAMTNFRSRTLDREFASILFVERTERAAAE